VFVIDQSEYIEDRPVPGPFPAFPMTKRESPGNEVGIWRIFYTDLRILLIQRIADLSNILARIVDFACNCNLVRILDCDFIVELLADPNLEKTIVGRRILLQIWADLYTPIHPPPLQDPQQ
jgi:hypothetical protein